MVDFSKYNKQKEEEQKRTEEPEKPETDITSNKTTRITQPKQDKVSLRAHPKQKTPDITPSETLSKQLEAFKIDIFTKLDSWDQKIKLLEIKDYGILFDILTAYIKQYQKQAAAVKAK